MYRKCATEISARHQKQITDALLRLMQKADYESITVTELCQAAGVSRRVFYHLFANKTGALYALVDQKILNLQSYSRNPSAELVDFFRYWKEEKPFLDALGRNGMSGLLPERMVNIVLTEDFDILYRLHRQGWSDRSRDVIIFSLSGLLGLVYSWYYEGFSRPAEAMALLVEQMANPNSRN